MGFIGLRILQDMSSQLHNATFWGSCPNNNLQTVDSWIMLVLLLFLPWSGKYFLIFKKLANMAAITAIPKIVSILSFVQQSHENDT